MKSLTSMLGWLLLVALVAVPSFLFYNWVMQGKKKAAAETASEAPAVNVFPPSQPAQPAQYASTQAPAALPGASSAASQPAPKPQASAPAQQAAAQQTPAQQPSASANAPAAASDSAASPAPAASPDQAQRPEVSTGAEQGVEVSTIPKPRSWYTPKSERDPTFTPADYRRLKEEQMQREEAERMQQYAERNKPREPGPETKISLQGIVGNAAIINGDMYTAGQTVRGIKIVKVGADYVICDFKGKKFKKVLK